MADELFKKLCKGLTPEEIERLRRDDLPIGEDAGPFEITEEEKERSQKVLMKFIEQREKAIQERKVREQGGNE